MKFPILFILFFTLTQTAITQTLNPANCDSTILTKQEFKKCKGDTIFNADIFERINYVTFLKTELLPKYRLKRTALTLPSSLKTNLKQLKRLYDSTVTYKLETFTREMDNDQKFVQPKAYISSVLALETFKIYPDVYAILLNPIHLGLKPKTTPSQLKQLNSLVYKVYNSMTKLNNSLVWELAEALNKEKRKYSTTLDMFQGTMNEEERSVYDIVNFLLWTE